MSSRRRRLMMMAGGTQDPYANYLSYADFVGAADLDSGSYTPEKGGAFTAPLGGTFVLDGSGGIKKTADDNTHQFLMQDLSDGDVVITGEVKMPAGKVTGVICRYVDTNNYVLVQFHQGTGDVAIYERLAGSFNLRGNSAVTLTADTYFAYTVTLSGSSASALINSITANGTLVTLLTGGKHGPHIFDSDVPCFHKAYRVTP